MIRMERMPVDPAHVPAEGAPVAPVQVRITTRMGQDINADKKTLSPAGMSYALVDVETDGECKDVGLPSRRGDRVVLFTSPSNKPINKFRKEGLATFYMPLWTLTELQTANTALGLGIPPATIIDRYTKIDGMARYVFALSDRIFDAYVNIDLPRRAVRVAPTHTAELVNASMFSGSADFLHSLAYFFVTYNGPGPADYTFTSMEVRWATKFIITEVIGKALDDVLDSRIRNAAYCHINVSNPSVVGYMYEGWTIRKLLIGGLTGMKWVASSPARASRFMFADYFGSGNTCTYLLDHMRILIHVFYFDFYSCNIFLVQRPFTVAYVDRLQMSERLRLADPGTLVVPTAFNYPVIDCVMKSTDNSAHALPLYASVQITVAHEHAMTPTGDQFFWDTMNAVFSNIPAHRREAHIRDRTAIFFSVPPSQFRSFCVPDVHIYPGRMLKLTLGDP